MRYASSLDCSQEGLLLSAFPLSFAFVEVGASGCEACFLLLGNRRGEVIPFQITTADLSSSSLECTEGVKWKAHDSCVTAMCTVQDTIDGPCSTRKNGYFVTGSAKGEVSMWSMAINHDSAPSAGDDWAQLLTPDGRGIVALSAVMASDALFVGVGKQTGELRLLRVDNGNASSSPLATCEVKAEADRLEMCTGVSLLLYGETPRLLACFAGGSVGVYGKGTDVPARAKIIDGGLDEQVVSVQGVSAAPDRSQACIAVCSTGSGKHILNSLRTSARIVGAS